MPRTHALWIKIMIRNLFSPKTGIIKKINVLMRNPNQPRLHYMISTMCDTSRFSSQLNDFAATGISMDQESAWWSALGEGIERYCAVFADMHEQRFASYSNLQKAGLQALAPDYFCLFSEAQYQDNNFRYEKPDKNTMLCWIKGYTLPDYASCYIPSALVFNAYQEQAEEQRIVPNIHPGVACGTELNQTILAAVYEIIERDSMMIWWLNQLPMPSITVPEQNRLHNIIAHNFPKMDKKNIELSFVWLKNDLDIPVVFCLLVDHCAQVVGGGCAARLNPEQALFKAFYEAVQTWLLALDLKRGDRGNVANLAQKGLFPKEVVSLTATTSPGTNILHNLLIYNDKKQWNALDLIRQTMNTVSLMDIPTPKREGEVELGFTLKQIQKRGLKPIIVDLSTPDITDVGLWVVRVYIPGMVPNTPTLYPPLGLNRLCNVPNILGFKTKEINKKVWNLSPLPYS